MSMLLRRSAVLGWSLLTFVAVLLMPALAHADAFTDAVGRGNFAAMSAAFVFGLGTALTPCVYPMVPITVAVFGAKGVSRRRALALASMYVFGMALTYGILGTIAGLTRAAFGALLGDWRFVVPLVLVLVALALSMFGAFEIALPMGLQQRLARVGGKGFTGAFLMGVVAGFIAAPCTGPPLFMMLTWVGTTGNATKGFLYLFTYALGIGVPFFAIAGFAAQLPKSGAWMESVKTIFGVVMLGAAIFFLRPIVPAIDAWTSARWSFLIGALALAAAGIALGAVHLSFHDTMARKLRKGVGVAMLVVGGFGAVNFMLAPTAELAWLKSEAEGVQLARAEGKPMVIDFGATWCLPCKELEKNVFSHPDVARELRKFTLVKVDLTHELEDESLAVLKQKYDVGALPSVRMATPDGRITGRVDGLIGVPEFLATLAKARSGSLAQR